MAQAYLIDALRSISGEGSPMRMRYVALADTPEQAVEVVRPLLSEEAEVRCQGETLSPAVARALGLKLGQARLV